MDIDSTYTREVVLAEQHHYHREQYLQTQRGHGLEAFFLVATRQVAHSIYMARSEQTSRADCVGNVDSSKSNAFSEVGCHTYDAGAVSRRCSVSHIVFSLINHYYCEGQFGVGQRQKR